MAVLLSLFDVGGGGMKKMTRAALEVLSLERREKRERA